LKIGPQAQKQIPIAVLKFCGQTPLRKTGEQGSSALFYSISLQMNPVGGSDGRSVHHGIDGYVGAG
jgi:hypothetical protein